MSEETADAAIENEVADKTTDEPMYLRQPIVSVLGHVDHGKTSVLDRIRGSTVVAREAGAITQHIGATEVPMETINEMCSISGDKAFHLPGLLFIDTPGHEAFTTLRARGGALADIAILVVDINEGFKPQTVEALNILKRCRTPFVVAANKIDLVGNWKQTKGPISKRFSQQDSVTQSLFEEKMYEVIGKLFDLGMQCERYDRIKDFRKNVAIVPICARSGEGMPEMLMVLVGLAQRFLEDNLSTSETGPAAGTVLEVKEIRGLGTTLDAIIYNGTLKASDTVVIGAKKKPVVTTIRALLKPKPLDEIRDPKETFSNVPEVHAAAGIRITAPNLEGVYSGAPLRVVRGNLDEVLAEVAEESEINIPLGDDGIVLKADTLGSLEAIAGELGDRGIEVRLADVGDVSKRDVIEAATHADPLKRVLLAFNVKVLPDAQEEADAAGMPVMTDRVIYSLLETYDDWVKKTKDELDRSQRETFVHPGMIRYLPGCTFRVNHPAVIGVRILAGRIRSGQKLMRDDGKTVGTIKSIQVEKKTIAEAINGQEAAIAIDGATVGRQISEEDILYVELPEGDAKILLKMDKLSSDEKEVLERVCELKRKADKFWAM
ncbi:MAG: translation initiation factor IF-2 [Thermoplasmata archaeon HGW-Thermoplasmata-1]|nr:MAG: translation initiation factor IF-2 [Thermoplasmata archaeon HGW-Thermoplasmata-1]